MSHLAGYEITWAARQHGDRTALSFGDQGRTFHQVNAQANRLANAFRSRLGLRTNDRVAVLAHNSFATVETLFGIQKAGLAQVALNARHAIPEHAQILADCRPGAVVVDASLLEAARSSLRLAGLNSHVISIGADTQDSFDYDSLLLASEDSEPAIVVDATDILRIQYTSGTTGKPKGVVHSQAVHYARLSAFFTALEYELGPGQSMAHVGPLTHAAGNYLGPYFIRGALNILCPRFDPKALLDLIASKKVTHLLLVPTMISRLVEVAQRRPVDLPSLSRINYGTAPMPVETLRRAVALFGPIFRQHYGMTEAAQPLTVLYPSEHTLTGSAEDVARLGSAGKPSLTTRLVLRDQTGAPVPAGSIGEITIQAKGVAAIRYWNNLDEDRRAIRDGWLYTGDLGRFDAAGYLYIVGRNKDLIISGGFNIYAREVEEALLAHPAVFEASVFGVPDVEWGEIVHAWIARRANSNVESEQLIDHCRTLIAGYKLPRRIRVLDDELPKNSSGKLDKRAMQSEVTAEMPESSESWNKAAPTYLY
jgi:acyl-CoA synthetase (AMP-forming)/AMP-acid ligase II